jgi:hypothetical protein
MLFFIPALLLQLITNIFSRRRYFFGARCQKYFFADAIAGEGKGVRREGEQEQNENGNENENENGMRTRMRTGERGMR